MISLGISAFYHDSAACLISDGEILGAAQEERFSRKKHDSSFPKDAVRFCLENSGHSPVDIDEVIFYEKPFLKFERILDTVLNEVPYGYKQFRKSLHSWAYDKLFVKKKLLGGLNEALGTNRWDDKLRFSDHHLSHAASAFFPSPFESAAVLTIDGVGEFATTSIGIGEGSSLQILREIHFPHSVGLLYSAVTAFLGFKVNSGEYKVMGLAPYGRPEFTERIYGNLIELNRDGSFQLNLSFFNFTRGNTMFNRKVDGLFDGPPRERDGVITNRDVNLAASIQEVLNQVVKGLAAHAKVITGQSNLCMAGGVALNCVANGYLQRSNLFDRIWVQPASNDSGGALGAAYISQFLSLKQRRVVSSGDSMKGSFLGPRYTSSEIRLSLDSRGLRYRVLPGAEMIGKVAELLSQGSVCGWFQGAMEFGPRALGSRSILADPRSPGMKTRLNDLVKKRESFRPFAPAVLLDDVGNWFDNLTESPYMSVCSHAHPTPLRTPLSFGGDGKSGATTESCIPAVLHVDSSARVQTVDRERNERFYDLILRFREITGVPILVNTSFNVRGEPIVCNPDDAIDCFFNAQLDALSIGDFLVLREEQEVKFQQLKPLKFEED